MYISRWYDRRDERVYLLFIWVDDGGGIVDGSGGGDDGSDFCGNGGRCEVKEFILELRFIKDVWFNVVYRKIK